MKTKPKPRKKQARLTVTHTIKPVVVADNPKVNVFNALIAIGLIFAALCVILILTSYFKTPSQINTTDEKYIAPSDIEWYFNRSDYLAYLKIRVNDLDNQTNSFILKHGKDETGYDSGEKDRIASLRGGLNMLKTRYNELAAEYNRNAQNMNKSWNRSLPRTIYDIP